MSDTVALVSLIPMSFLMFFDSTSVRRVCMTSSFLIFASCLAFSIQSRYFANAIDFNLLVSIGAFVFCAVYFNVRSQGTKVYSLLGFGFILQGLIAPDAAAMLILLISADTLFCVQGFAESKSAQERREFASVLQKGWTCFIPAISGLLLKTGVETQAILTVVSICFRLNVLPLPFWGRPLVTSGVVPELALTAVPCFALWHSMGQIGSSWSTIWYLIALLASLGAPLRTVVFLLGLSIGSLHTEVQFIIPALWPLMLIQGRQEMIWRFLLAFGGAVPVIYMNAEMPEAILTLCVFAGIVFSRIAFSPLARDQKANWFELVLVFGFFVPGIVWFVRNGLVLPEEPDANMATFVGSFLICGMLWFLVKKQGLKGPVSEITRFSSMIEKTSMSTIVPELTIPEDAPGPKKFEGPLARILLEVDPEVSTMILVGLGAVVLAWVLY